MNSFHSYLNKHTKNAAAATWNVEMQFDDADMAADPHMPLMQIDQLCMFQWRRALFDDHDAIVPTLKERLVIQLLAAIDADRRNVSVYLFTYHRHN
jgi:hypothetical protein